MKFNKGELIVPLVMAAFLAAYYFQVRDIPPEVLEWPLYLAIALTVLLIIVLVIYLPGKPGQDGGEETRNPGAILKPFILTVATVVFLIAMKFIGFTFSCFLYLSGVQLFLGSLVKRTLIVSIVVVFFLHTVMVVGLGLPVPRLITPYFKL